MTTYAIIETGGKQYRVAPGDVIDVDRIPDLEPGSALDIDKVLLVKRDDALSVGTPYVDGARVVAKVVGERKGEKIIVFKYKPKVRYRRKKGHRQLYSRIEITDIRHGEPAAPRSRSGRGAKAAARSKGKGDGDGP